MEFETNQLIAALREELSQYGEMLALLDTQQELVVQRGSDQLLESVAAVNRQSDVIRQAREHRGQCQRQVAVAAGQSEDIDLKTLYQCLPESPAILVKALVEENNDLLVRVQQRARQNHILLTRSLDLMQQLMSAFVPSAAPRTYTDRGTVYGEPGARKAVYEAVG